MGDGEFHIFWHALFWNLILPPSVSMQKKARQVFLRAIDYAWYFTSIIATIMAINNVQSHTLSRELERMFNEDQFYLPLLEEHLRQLPSACTEVGSTTYVPDGDYDQNSLSGARRICAVFTNLKRRNNHALRETCRVRPRPYYEIEAGQLDVENPFPAPLSEALKHIALACQLESETYTIEEIQDAMRRSDMNSSNPLEQIGWFYALAAIVGLRLVKTSADVADALRK